VSGLQFTWLKKGDRHADIPPLLKIQSLTVRVGMRRVLEDIQVDIYKGDHVLVTGPNGCGKSTLLNAIMGVPPASIVSGLIEFRSQNVTRLPTHERACLGVAYMRQKDNIFPGLSIRDNLHLSLGKAGPALFQELFPEWSDDLLIHKLAGTLSGGERQKLAWGITALTNAPLIMADELFAGISDRQRNSFYTRKSLGQRTFLQIEHVTHSHS